MATVTVTLDDGSMITVSGCASITPAPDAGPTPDAVIVSTNGNPVSPPPPPSVPDTEINAGN